MVTVTPRTGCSGKLVDKLVYVVASEDENRDCHAAILRRLEDQTMAF